MMERKTDLAYSIIKQKIITGVYKPMMDLSEEALQNELGYSRTPVREALLKLNDEGFIVVFPKKGTIVSPVNQQLIDEVYEARLVNEPYVCQKSAKIMPREILLDIKAQLAIPTVDINDEKVRNYYIGIDDRLHKSILQFCTNRFIVKTMSLIYDHNSRFRYFSSQPTSDNSVKEHIAIIDAMLDGDSSDIYKASVQHIEESKHITISTFLVQDAISSFKG